MLQFVNGALVAILCEPILLAFAAIESATLGWHQDDDRILYHQRSSCHSVLQDAQGGSSFNAAATGNSHLGRFIAMYILTSHAAAHVVYDLWIPVKLGSHVSIISQHWI